MYTIREVLEELFGHGIWEMYTIVDKCDCGEPAYMSVTNPDGETLHQCKRCYSRSFFLPAPKKSVVNQIIRRRI